MRKRIAIIVLTAVMLMAAAPIGVYAGSNITVKVVVPELEYEYITVSPFSDGLAAVWRGGTNYGKGWGGGKMGFIDKAGNEVIPCVYEEVNDFSEGLAVVQVDGKWGYIDTTGEFVIPPIYLGASSFSEGLAAVVVEGEGYYDSKRQYIDKSGKTIISTDFDAIYDFKEGLAVVYKRIDGKMRCGYIDKTGEIVIPFKYHTAFDFSEGLAMVATNEGWGYIDKTGEIAVPLIYSHGLINSNFSEGLAAVKLISPQGFWTYYVDNVGNEVIKLGNVNSRQFSEGLAAVYNTTEWEWKWGFIDRDGNTVIPYDYYTVSDFKDGISAVNTKSSGGYLDRAGNMVVPLEYSRTVAFSEGYAAAEKDGKWLILRMITPTQITAAFGAVKYVLDGEPFEKAAIVHNGTAYLPAAYLAEKLGLSAKWDSETNTTALTSSQINSNKLETPKSSEPLLTSYVEPITKSIIVKFGATDYVLDGEPLEEDTMVYDGTAYLPAAYLAEKLGLTAQWDKDTDTTTLTSK